VDHGEITGFMMAMTMGYSVKNPGVLDSLSPEDRITADVVVNGDDVWLENIGGCQEGGLGESPCSAGAEETIRINKEGAPQKIPSSVSRSTPDFHASGT